MTVQVHKLAQRALANSFEHLAELAESGRFKVAGERFAATMPGAVTKMEVDAVLSFAEDVITYARQQLEYMPASRFKYNDYVQAVDRANGNVIVGRIVGSTRAGHWRVEVPAVEGCDAYSLEVPDAELQHAPKPTAVQPMREAVDLVLKHKPLRIGHEAPPDDVMAELVDAFGPDGFDVLYQRNDLSYPPRVPGVVATVSVKGERLYEKSIEFSLAASRQEIEALWRGIVPAVRSFAAKQREEASP